METHEPNVYSTILGGVLRGFWSPFFDLGARSTIFCHLEKGPFVKILHTFYLCVPFQIYATSFFSSSLSVQILSLPGNLLCGMATTIYPLTTPSPPHPLPYSLFVSSEREILLEVNCYPGLLFYCCSLKKDSGKKTCCLLSLAAVLQASFHPTAPHIQELHLILNFYA